MKLLSFTRLGKTGFGAVVKDGIIDLTGKLDPEINSIKKLISLDMEDEAEEYIAGKTKDLSFSDFTFFTSCHGRAALLVGKQSARLVKKK